MSSIRLPESECRQLDRYDIDALCCLGCYRNVELGSIKRLYMTSMDGAVDIAAIKREGITLVINVNDIDTSQELIGAYKENGISFAHLRMEDVDRQPIEAVGKEALALSDLTAGSTLVHCEMGVSRSVAIACYIMMSRSNDTLACIMETITAVRCVAQPNRGFVSQLEALDKTMTRAPPKRSGQLYCLIGPSGVGKDTLVNRLIDADPSCVAKVRGYTTRERRPSEVAGVDMHFITVSEFIAMRDANQFKEYVVVHGNMYGMTEDSLSTSGGMDKIAIVTIRALQQCHVMIAVLLTVSDPTKTLRERLTKRGDNEASIAVRMATASDELVLYEEKMGLFDHVISCDNSDAAFNQMRTIMGYR